MVVAVALQGLGAGAAADVEPAMPERIEETPAPGARGAVMITLAEAEALHDEAAALTPVGVALDERAQTSWLPRIGRLEAAVDDPRVDPEVREELQAALRALAAVGLAGGRP